MGNKNTEILIDVRNITKYFYSEQGLFYKKPDIIKAVDNISFGIEKGKTLGLVGESGCGKTTLGHVIINLEIPTSGEVKFEGEIINSYDNKRYQKLRQKMQIIFQDPYSSLNPRKTIGSIIKEPLDVHNIGSRNERQEKVMDILKVVGMSPEHYNKYAHEFSGGQRQRICIARALILKPAFVVCDEPVSALDVSIQSQIINLLEDLQKDFELTYLFISHDLSVVEHISNNVAVMYLGRFVELANSFDLYNSPYHPYTKALLSASPIPDPNKKKDKIILEGDIPSPISPPDGCHFSTRCQYVIDKCNKVPGPPWEEICPTHWVRCWRAKEIHNK